MLTKYEALRTSPPDPGQLGIDTISLDRNGPYPRKESANPIVEELRNASLTMYTDIFGQEIIRHLVTQSGLKDTVSWINVHPQASRKDESFAAGEELLGHLRRNNPSLAEESSKDRITTRFVHPSNIGDIPQGSLVTYVDLEGGKEDLIRTLLRKLPSDAMLAVTVAPDARVLSKIQDKFPISTRKHDPQGEIIPVVAVNPASPPIRPVVPQENARDIVPSSPRIVEDEDGEVTIFYGRGRMFKKGTVYIDGYPL